MSGFALQFLRAISSCFQLEFTTASLWMRRTTSRLCDYSRYVLLLVLWIPSNYTTLFMALKDEPKWVPYNRSDDTDLNPYRTQYLLSVGGQNPKFT